MALLFVGTVLSFKWWRLIVVPRYIKNRNHGIKEKQQSRVNNSRQVSNHQTIGSEGRIRPSPKSKSKSKTLTLTRLFSNWGELLNKKAKTCDMVEFGQVIAINNQSMTVANEVGQEYVIPTYYIREYDQESVIIDTSARYLYHYKSQEKLQEPFIRI